MTHKRKILEDLGKQFKLISDDFNLLSAMVEAQSNSIPPKLEEMPFKNEEHHSGHLWISYSNPKLLQSPKFDIVSPPTAAGGKTSDTKNKSDEAFSLGGEQKEMSVQFTDGSFRIVSSSGLMQYRFVYKSKQMSVYGKSKAECWQKRLEFTQSTPKKKSKPDITYCEWANKWLATYKQNTVELAYYNSIIGNLNNHIFPVIGNKGLKAIKPLELQELLNDIVSENVRTKCATILGDSLRQAKVCGLIANSPYEGVKIKRYQQPELGALTHKQQKQLLAYIDSSSSVAEEMRDFIRCLLMTGMRQNELVGLRAMDVDFNHMEINVLGAWKRANNVRGKTKTRSGKRCMPIAQPLADILKKYVDRTAAKNKLFSFKLDHCYKTLAKILGAIGLEYTGNIIRHTFITNAYEFGFPPFLIQRWVGHRGFEEDNVYLALRKAQDYVETEITYYMLLLKKTAVISK